MKTVSKQREKTHKVHQKQLHELSLLILDLSQALIAVESTWKLSKAAIKKWSSL